MLPAVSIQCHNFGFTETYMPVQWAIFSSWAIYVRNNCEVVDGKVGAPRFSSVRESKDPRGFLYLRLNHISVLRLVPKSYVISR